MPGCETNLSKFLLELIARDDGSRGLVTRHLFACTFVIVDWVRLVRSLNLINLGF